MSTETRSQKDARRFEHIMDDLLELNPDDGLRLALALEGISGYRDLVDLISDEKRINDLEYQKTLDDGTCKTTIGQHKQ